MPGSREDAASDLGGVVERLAALVRSAGAESDRLALETLRAGQRTAQAVEEIARHGVRLREPPPAVWAE